MKAKLARNARAKVKRTLTVEDLSALPFRCANCSSVIEVPKTYCEQLCSQEAEWVRYVRRCRLDGRDKRSDVIEAIKIRLAHILAGGYDKLARKLPDSVREAIFKRDQGRCRLCGKPGTEIDHISGSSSDPENLQLLCDSCHNNKTVASFVRLTKDSHPEAWEKAQLLKRRAAARLPLQLCDSEDWGELQKQLLKKRRELMRAKEASVSHETA
jgi:5-methylcytosine-specific restriction endonuclease McrA